jgi:hypothetical protein
MSFVRSMPAEVVLAYRSLFSGSSPAVAIVLTDLAERTGFYKVEAEGQPVEELNYAAGLRAAFGPIFEIVNLSGDQLAALERDDESAEGR